jgi:hypothetical protein
MNYSEDELDIGNVLTPVLHKRASFKHEQEVRAISVGEDVLRKVHEPHATGVWQPIDLAALISEIYVAPQAPSWFREVIEVTQRKFGFSLPVIQSSPDELPGW